MKEDEAIFYLDYAVNRVLPRTFNYRKLDKKEETIIGLCINTVMSECFDSCECSYDREPPVEVIKSCFLLKKLPEAFKVVIGDSDE